MIAKKPLFVTLGIIFWVFTLIFALLPSWPHLYYRLSPQTSDSLASTLASTIPTPSSNLLPSFEPKTNNQQPSQSLPDIDPSLPAENGLIIDKIGVRGEIHEGEDWTQLLKLGIWRVPNFGTPTDTNKPIILAAHRWGYLSWSSAFRKLNSFYSLPKLKVGDKIKLIWNQRQFEYEVSAVASGTEITDYTADLILYTCQLWNSPLRFFVYAHRLP